MASTQNKNLLAKVLKQNEIKRVKAAQMKNSGQNLLKARTHELKTREPSVEI